MVQPFLQLGQLMIVGGEQGAGAVGFVQGLGRGPGDGQTVIGGGAAPDLVQHDEAAPGRLGQDGGGFDHLHHEGGAAARQIVARAHATEQTVDHAQLHGPRRDEGPGLRQHHQKRVLAQEGRLTRHVRAGDDGQARGPDAVARQRAVVGGVGQALRLHRRLDHRMAARLDGETEAVVDAGTHGPDLFGPFGQGGVGVQFGQRLGHALQRPGKTRHLAAPALEGLGLDGQGAVPGLADLGVQLRQFDGGEAHLIGQGLAVDEGAVRSRAQQAFRRLGAGLEEVAEDGVVAHLEGDAAIGDRPGFQLGDDLAAVVAQGAGSVQFGAMARVHIAAVARQVRRLVHQAVGQFGQQVRQVALKRQLVEAGRHPRGRPGQRIIGRGGEQGAQTLRRLQP